MASDNALDELIRSLQDLNTTAKTLQTAISNSVLTPTVSAAGASPPIPPVPGGPAGPGSVGDPIMLMILQELAKISRATGESARDAKSTHEVLINPEFKDSTTKFGRWTKRMKTWLPMRKRMAKEGGVAGLKTARALGMGSSGRHVMGQAGSAAGAMTAFGLAIYEGINALQSWTEATFNSYRQISQVSGSIAAVMAERDIHQMMRDLRFGEGTKVSARDLMEKESAGKDTLNTIAIPMQNLWNSVQGALWEIADTLLSPIKAMVEFMGDDRAESRKFWSDVSDTLDKEGGLLRDMKTLLEHLQKKPGGEGGGVAGVGKEMMDRLAAIDKAGMEMMREAEKAASKGAAAPSGAMPHGRIGP